MVSFLGDSGAFGTSCDHIDAENPLVFFPWQQLIQLSMQLIGPYALSEF